ncbi:hypothetical protein LWI28_020141 [Acer negundo]|uniref:Alcohol dehydrogenase-like N-terminal domain-containing protein n=1 Tax=Acer negundo TaxID=4023 RepID=A0AAD5IJX9_ACENE|nr:hypothetical protein LWI28_020141 [Acer negundo]
MVKLHSFDTKIHKVDSDNLVYPTRTMKTMADYDNLSIHILFTRKIGTDDVLLKVLFCGMDHTDLHQIKSEIYPPSYPLVPGHEVVGEVVELGTEVKKFKVGDIVGVGCLVGSCGECLYCDSNLENYCNDRLFSYTGINKDGTCTQGGSSSAKVVHQNWWGCKAPAHDLILGRKTITGSFIGSIETREILDFWAEKGLSSMIEVVKMDYANKAFEGMERNDVRYRFVPDVAGSNMK